MAAESEQLDAPLNDQSVASSIDITPYFLPTAQEDDNYNTYSMSLCSRADDVTSEEVRDSIVLDTHNSILNLTEDDGEESEVASAGALQRSFLFEDDDDVSQAPLNQSIDASFAYGGGDKQAQEQQQLAPSTPHRCQPPSSPTCCAVQPATPTASTSALTDWADKIMDTSTTSLRNVTESLVESLCPSLRHNDELADHPTLCASIEHVSNYTITASQQLVNQVECDIESLLGCPAVPTDDELMEVWWDPLSSTTDETTPMRHDVTTGKNKHTTTPLPFRPRRGTIKTRADRIRRLREEHDFLQNSPVQGNGPPAMEHHSLVRTKSMDDAHLATCCTKKVHRSAQGGGDTWLPHDNSWFSAGSDELMQDLSKLIGKGIDPILPEGDDEDEEEELCYDSDPGEVCFSSSHKNHPGTIMTSSQQDVSLLDHDEKYYIPYDAHRNRVAAQAEKVDQRNDEAADDRHTLLQTVQDTLNSTWTLKWHPTSDNLQTQSTQTTPNERKVLDPVPTTTGSKGVNIWIERGSLLNLGDIVVEPKIMWREVYQPDLSTSRKLNLSTQNPYSLRLLTICRIVAAHTLDRTRHPFARPSCSFFVRDCHGDEYLFEASSPTERDAIVKSWKLVVARLASLAVVEDMNNLALEFFTPEIKTSMLTL